MANVAATVSGDRKIDCPRGALVFREARGIRNKQNEVCKECPACCGGSCKSCNDPQNCPQPSMKKLTQSVNAVRN